MKICIVTFLFPPYNSIGSLRLGKTAKYLHLLGHELLIITANNQKLPETLPIEIPKEKVYYGPWFDFNFFQGGSSGGISTNTSFKSSKVAKFFFKIVKTFLFIPDDKIGWYLDRKNILRRVGAFDPDVILGSGGPFTSLILAKYLSSKLKIPWIAELRDLWADSHNYEFFEWRRKLEKVLEKRILLPAAGLVTVSEELEKILNTNYDVPIKVIYNGFDNEDVKIPSKNKWFKSESLNIVYTGRFYPNAYDLQPLVQVIKKTDNKFPIKLHFFGVGVEKHILEVLAPQDYSLIGKNIIIHGQVSYKDSLVAQKTADILVFFEWSDKKYKGIYSGKIFEYLHSKRPILSIGESSEFPNSYIKNYNLGLASKSIDEIEKFLEQKYQIKFRNNSIADIEHSEYFKFSRKEQTNRLVEFINKVI